MTATLLRYWAAAREAAGAVEDEVSEGTLGEALAEAVARRGVDGARLAELFEVSAYLVDGDPVGRRDPYTVRLQPGAVVEVLPPFAGG